MRVYGDEQLCPSYKECQEFQKLVELKDFGLVVYYHRPRKEDIRHGEAVESAANTPRDTFILHNKEDETITTSELFLELEKKNISCPRCRVTFEHAQKLMQEVKSIDRKIVMGICEHCRKKAQTIKKSFCACDEIVKKFISVKSEQKEDNKKYVKICLSKLGHLHKDDITLNKPKQIKTRAYSELQINRGLNSSACRHEPEVQQMFYSEKHRSDININTETRETDLKEGIKEAVAFSEPSSEHAKTTFAHTQQESDKINTMVPSTSLVDSDTTFVDTSVGVKELPTTSLQDRKQEEVFKDIPSMDAKEALKRRHDLSLRQMMRLQKDLGVPYSVSKRPNIYETPKIAPWAQKEPTSKYHVKSKMDIKIPTLKHNRGPHGTRDLDYVSNREVKFRSTRALQDSYIEPRKLDKYHYDKTKQGLYDSEQGPNKVKKLEDRHLFSDEKFKLQRSVDKICHQAKKPDRHVVKSKSGLIESMGNVLKPQFSLVFPKLKEKEENEINLNVSSLQLIKDTQKFRLQTAGLKKSQEEERKQKFERDQKKKVAREKKKLRAEEKKRQAVEDKKYAEDQKIQQDKAKRDKTISYHQTIKEKAQIIPQKTKTVQKQSLATVLSKQHMKQIEMKPGKGVIRYALSDRTFIDKGWTMLPTEKVLRKMNVYRMRPAHPEFDWFKHNKNKRLMTYDSGERLAEFDNNGRGRWYYRNGRLALDYYDAEETNSQQRFVVYSSGEPDEHGHTHPITTLATFDYLGNGIVFDHAGKIRLNYNQSEGVVLDRAIGPFTHWLWHSLNNPPVLQKVMIDTQMVHKDPDILKLGSAADTEATRPDNEEMLAVEFQNLIKERSKKYSKKCKPFQIKMKALKINEHFSLKVLDQATVYLIFRDGSTNLKLNIGMILDNQEIVDTDIAEMGEVSNSLKRCPARTDSLAGLQRSVAQAQRYERQHAERQRRIRPQEPCASADHLTAAASPPMRLPLRIIPTGSSSSTGYSSRKPTNSVCCNTRLRF